MVIASLLSVLGRALAPKFAWMPMTEEMGKRLAENKDKYAAVDDEMRDEEMECSELLACVESRDGMHYLEYMNINCGYEMVYHLNIPILHACDDKNVIVYLTYISLTMHGLNYAPYWMMSKISDAFLRPNAECST